MQMTRPLSVLALMRVLSPSSISSQIFGSVVVDEVVSVGLSIDGEQSGRGEPVAQGGVTDVVVHDVDEEPDDV
ncbi:MAG: hypothetical protein J4G14_13430 [Dehalococcoidia bacterium]|nr:hypothetical protein [Dehalococcoidia bacterium]